MPKIHITEIDNTIPGALDENFDVVYIPGFVNTNPLNDDEEKNGVQRIAPRVPTLFTSLQSFNTLCGSAPATFKTAQKYASLNTNDAQGFTSDAVSFTGKMFEEGDADPSYIMAKELLAAGMNVLYERVNPDIVLASDTPVEVDSDLPKDSTIQFHIPAYRKILSPIAPRIFTKVNAGQEYKVGGANNPTFYKCVEQFEDGDTSFADVDHFKCSFTAVTDLGASTKATYALKEVEEDGTTNYYVTADSHLYIKSGEYYEEGIGTASQLPLVLDEKGKPIKDIASKPFIVSTPLNEYPTDWITDYHKYFYEKVDLEVLGKTDNTGSITIEDKDIVSAMGVSDSDDLADVFEASGVKYIDLRDCISITYMYEQLADIFSIDNTEGLVDRGNYSVKYLTSGGYPTFEYDSNSLTTKMLALAEKRGDCVAIIDHTDNPYREKNVDKAGSVYKAVLDSDALKTNGEFGAMFTPWATYNRTTVDRIAGDVNDEPVRLGGSYAYLGALADSLKTNASWLAVAGATRGKVQNLSDNGIYNPISNGAADYMQPRSSADYDGIAVNAITNIKPYGNVIWGNRTLYRNEDNLVARSFLNIRNLVSDVKKICYRTARKLTFEQNNDILWVNFKSMIAPTLDRMVSGYGLSGYKFVRDTERPEASAKATLCAKILLYPIEPVEDFYITIMLEDDEVTVQ